MPILLFCALFILQCTKLIWEYSSEFQCFASYLGELEKLLISDSNKLSCFWISKPQCVNTKCELTETLLLLFQKELISQIQRHNLVPPMTKQKNILPSTFAIMTVTPDGVRAPFSPD